MSLTIPSYREIRVVLCRIEIDQSGEEYSGDQCGPISEINFFLIYGAINQAKPTAMDGKDAKEQELVLSTWYLALFGRSIQYALHSQTPAAKMLSINFGHSAARMMPRGVPPRACSQIPSTKYQVPNTKY